MRAKNRNTTDIEPNGDLDRSPSTGDGAKLEFEPIVDYSAAYAGKRTKPSQTPPSRIPFDAQRYVAVVTVVVVMAIGSVFLIQRDAAPISPMTSNWRPLPAKDPEVNDEPNVASVQKAKPVRIRNEFDHSEVFEFPPGTSQREAREQVAKILLERAAQRHASSRSKQK